MNPTPIPTAPRACPICGGCESAPVYSQRFQGIARAALLSGYEVCVCRACGCGFADDIPSQEEFDAYYRDLSKYENPSRDGGESTYDFADCEAGADSVQGLIPDKRSLLVDIGCATGGLLAAFKRRGFENLLGIDPSPGCAAAAARIHGIKVIPGTLSHLPKLESPADFVMLTGVLEHVREPAALLANVCTITARTARIHVAVPDVTKFSEWPNAPFQHFSLEHINFFSPRSLSNLLGVAGFRNLFMRQVGREQNFGTVEPIIHATFERDNGEKRPSERDEETEPALRTYVEQCRHAESEGNAVISRLVASAEPIVVWGVGTHTQRLLASTGLARANIQAFVDSNPKYQGKALVGRPIIPPGDLQTRSEAILISSWMYQQEIEEQIKGRLKLPNQVIKIYKVTSF